MPTFDTLDASQAHALISAPDWLDANRCFAGIPTPEHPEGWADHWQKGYGYAGPLPHDSDAQGDYYRGLLDAVFVTEDCVSDVVERRRNGLLGKEPGWAFETEETDAEGQDPDAPNERLDALNAVMAEWWDAGGVHGKLKDFADGLAVAGSPLLRLYVPYGRLQEGANGERGIPAGTTAEAALQMIAVAVLYPDQGVVYEDPATLRKLGVVAFDPEALTVTAGEGGALPEVELAYLQPDKPEADALTVIRTIGGAEEAEPWEGDLRGALPVYQSHTRPLVSAGVRSNQIDLNTTRTMAAINNHYAGFPSLHFVNVKPPTVRTGDGQGGTQEVPISGMPTGAGQMGFFVSHTNQDGQALNSQLHRVDPVDNSSLRESAREAREAIYRSAKQFHVLALTGAALSGDAMIQAQGEYLLDLLDKKAEVDRAGKWLLETAWAFAQALAGVPTDKDIRCVFDCRVNAGPLPSSLRQRILEEYGAGVLSLETAMSLLGVDDTQAERDRIKEEAETADTNDLQAQASRLVDEVFGRSASGDGQRTQVPTLAE